MSAAATPAELVATWTPWLRRVAFETNNNLQDVLQLAWLLAAELQLRQRRVKLKATFEAIWLRQVGWACSRMACRITVDLADLPEAGHCDEPSAILQAIQAVEELGDLDQLIQTPFTSKEIAGTLGKSERQGRRIKRKLEAIGAVQADFWRVAA